MASHKRAQLALTAFRCFTSKLAPARTPAPQPISRIPRPGPAILAHNTPKVPILSSLTSHRLGIFNSNQFLGCGAKRFYYVDQYKVRHFRPRGPRRWFENPRNVLIVVLVGSGVVITVYFGKTETVPYTKRKHVVLMSKAMEKKLGEVQFEQLKASFKGKILPAIHPDSVRVRLISQDIIQSLQRALKHEQVWSDVDYASAESGLDYEAGQNDTLAALTTEKGHGGMEGSWYKQDEILDDKWVQESRKKGHDSSTSHLDGLNWEVLVVNDPLVNAFCLPGGKIVVFTGLFKHFRTDTEIATIIGHEVGHAVARHVAEQITKNLWFAVMQLILYQFITPDLANMMSALFLRLPFSRRMEMEADYIGLLLMASAGYDPRIAPTVYEKLGKIGGESSLQNYLSTHPSGKKRAELLSQAKVMEEALTIYREVRTGLGVQGFL
ncbi:uncharacterized protein LOC116203747 [Punica granatum]|uniref:Uncharacterized protein n=2 Tax=Punica granatum TaxID=22663 RepID=A0A2I0KDF4_PUNGR|nr:uncharacterized protein LOC116203747 [Punica granatum]PKI65786.1 hypothetical protein CRG98_013858 [Punica granatum]